MIFLPIYRLLLSSEDENDVFHKLTSSFTDSITYWDYFVNWAKVRDFAHKYELDLNALNCLIGKPNPEETLRWLLSERPSIAGLLPVLLACRDHCFTILVNYTEGEFSHEYYSFNTDNKHTEIEIKKMIEFSEKSGLLDIFRNKDIKSVPDYVFGIQVGIDTNGRKGRHGTAMESLVGSMLKVICVKYSYELRAQVTADYIKHNWGISIKSDRLSRRYDFAVKTPQGVFLIETNFYGGGGSKLKATAGEYLNLYSLVKADNVGFIWITDGLGWHTATSALEDTFYRIPYVLNLYMASRGVLETILTETII